MSRSLRCGFSFWGFLERPCDSDVVETPDGLRGERHLMVDELLRRGHSVVQLQQRREKKPYSLLVPGACAYSFVDDDHEGLPDLSVLFVEWRWRIVGKPTVDWDRQVELLDHYSRVGTPIVVLDTDLKVTAEDERRWPAVTVCDPCLAPKELTRPRVRMPFCSDFSRVHEARQGSVHYRYVGNNYERDDQFQRYYSAPARQLRERWGLQTTVHGNWLTPSPERQHPRGVLQAHPDVAFVPRLSFRDVHGALNDSIAVCHITKPEYARHGNITMRYLEAIAAGVPALVPAECAPMREVGDGCGLLVNGPDDVARKVKNLADMSAIDRQHLVSMQERVIRTMADFSPGHRVDMIEAAARKELEP